ncbi:MAG: hypothetical protein JSR67_03640 [Proteobacteria bacterium]|nr:hypothetical protein [Pseudomonadota bacterium]
MAYATGSTPSNATAVLQALATWCTGYGWTVDNNAAYSGGWWLAVHKGACFLNYVVPSTNDRITMYGATGFSGAATPSTQAQTSLGFQITPLVGPYSAYHFFSSSSATYLHVCLEVASNVFAHMHGGLLSSFGGASPGIYVSVSAWNSYTNTGSGDTSSSYPDGSHNVRPFDTGPNYYSVGSGAVCATVDTTFRWFGMGGGNYFVSPNRVDMLGFTTQSTQRPPWNRSGLTRSPNSFDGVAVLFSIPIFAERAAGGIYSMIGEVPDVRMVNMTNNNAKDEITIGTDVWKLYPLVANSSMVNTSGANASSYPYGLAFRKNA